MNPTTSLLNAVKSPVSFEERKQQLSLTAPLSRPKRFRAQNRCLKIYADRCPRDGFPGPMGIYKSLRLDVGRYELDRPGNGEVLCRVRKVAVCGSDLHAVLADGAGYSSFSGPAAGWERGLTLGHEFVGQIVARGEGVDLPLGQLVTADSVLPCRRYDCPTCRSGLLNYCPQVELVGLQRDGAFAEYVTIPATAVYSIEPLIDRYGFEKAVRLGTLAEPFGVALNAVADATHHARYGACTSPNALIVGGGPIGVLMAIAFRAHGYGPVVVLEPNPIRAQIARAFADYVYDPEDYCCEAYDNAFGGDGPTVVVEASGAVDLQQAVDYAAPGGVVVTVARTGRRVCIDADMLISLGKCVLGARGHVGHVPQAISLIAESKLDFDRLITAKLSGLDALQAYLSQPAAWADQMKVVCNVGEDH